MIHKSSVIDNKAKVGKNVEIGPYSIIGPNVEISDNVIIHSHVNIQGDTKIGEGTKIFPFSTEQNIDVKKILSNHMALDIGNKTLELIESIILTP